MVLPVPWCRACGAEGRAGEVNLYMPGVVNLPSPNKSDRQGATPRALVLHVEGGTDAAIQSWFVNPQAQVSAHFSVSKTGRVTQYVSTADAAWANGITTGADPADHGAAAGFIASLNGANPNRYSCSIEHEGQSGEDMTDAQFTASVGIAAWLFGKGGALEGVSVDRTTVIRHSEIGSHPQCPGFPEDRFTKYIAAVNAALGGDEVVSVMSNTDAINAFMDVVNGKDDAIANRSGSYIGTLSGAPAGYRDIVVRVKES